MGKLLLLTVALAALIGAMPSSAYAVAAPSQPKNRGLYMSPIRNYLSLTPGSDVTRAFTVANLTDRPITVRFSVEKFSVADYSYDYKFAPTDNGWIRITQEQVQLEPNKSRQIPYRVSIPRDATIGGQYYTLLATSDLNRSGLASTARVASMLYLTVDGPLKRTSQILSSSIPRVVISPTIPYELSVKNTGNIHYFANFTAAVDGLFYHNEPSGVSRLLMPGAPRTIENSIPSPLLPGIYKLTYSYTPDLGVKLGGSQYFIFVPPWSWALVLIAGFILFQFMRRRKHKTAASRPSSTSEQ